MPDATIPFERILAPIPPGFRRDNEYAADGSGRDYAYEYFDIEEARRAVVADKLRGDEADEIRQQAQPLTRSADWNRVLTLGLTALTDESKDLTIVAWVVEALAHLRGFAGLTDGFTLFRRLQGRYRDSSFPRDPGDPRVQCGPYEFLSGERNLPYLIRSLPLAQPDRGVGYSLFHRREADRNERRLADWVRKGEDPDDFEPGLFLLRDWRAVVEQTPPGTLTRLADDLAACLIAFRAWERATDRLWRGVRPEPDLSPIGTALVDCAEEVARIQPEPNHPSAEALLFTLRRYADGRPPAPRRPDPEPVPEPEPQPEPVPEPDRLPSRDEVISRPIEPARSRPAESERRPVLDLDPPTADLPATTLTDEASAYRQVAEAAAFLRRINPHDPVPYLLVRSLRLGALFEVEGAEPADLPPAPPSATRRELRRCAAGGDWDAVLDQTEAILARPEGAGWFDAHRLAVRALEELGRDAAASACRGLLAAALSGAAERIDGELDDGTAASSAETRPWLLDLLGTAGSSRAERSDNHDLARIDPEPLPPDEANSAPLPDALLAAEALLRDGRDAEAAAALQVALDAQPGERARFLLTVRFADACRAEGADRLASALLEGLFAEADGAALRAWEGRAFFAPAAALLRDALNHLDDPTAADRLARAQARVMALAPSLGLRREDD